MSQTNVPPEISGTAQDAQNWISASDLPEEKKHALLCFTKQFPTLTFFKQERLATDPAWLRILGEALLGFVPDDLCWFRFAAFRYSPDRDSLANSAKIEVSWYHRLVFDADLGEYDQIFLGDEPVVFVACVLEDLSSLLAVKVGTDGDEGVYEFAYSFIDDIGSRQGRVDPTRARRVFDSYPDMLNHLGASNWVMVIFLKYSPQVLPISSILTTASTAAPARRNVRCLVFPKVTVSMSSMPTTAPVAVNVPPSVPPKLRNEKQISRLPSTPTAACWDTSLPYACRMAAYSTQPNKQLQPWLYIGAVEVRATTDIFTIRQREQGLLSATQRHSHHKLCLC